MPATIIPLKKAADESSSPPVTEQSKLKPREQTKVLLETALATGIRGALRDAVKTALDIATAPVKRDLTDLQYEALAPGQKLLDPNRPGFLARATRRGVRFIYRYAHPETGRQTEFGLGYLGDITLADARQLWQELRAQRMAGKVPSVVEDTASRDIPSLAKLCQLYLDEYASQVKRSWRDDERLLKRHVIPAYGDWPADAFTTDEARRLFRSLDGTPRERDKVRACLSTLFNVAVGRTKKLTVDETWLPSNFVNPITNAATAKHNADVNFPALAEARAYYQALVGADCPIKQDYADVLLLQLLTSSRIREVTDMEWAEVDRDAGRWVLPAARSKNGREHVVLLSKPALELLKRRHEWKAPRDTFVFPSALNPQTQPLRADLVSSALAKNRETLGVGPRFTSHNVRHLFSTWAGERQTPVDLVNRCTAHVVAAGINKHYNAAKLDVPAKALWAEWASWLDG